MDRGGLEFAFNVVPVISRGPDLSTNWSFAVMVGSDFYFCGGDDQSNGNHYSSIFL